MTSQSNCAYFNEHLSAVVPWLWNVVLGWDYKWFRDGTTSGRDGTTCGTTSSSGMGLQVAGMGLQVVQGWDYKWQGWDYMWDYK